MPTPPTDRAEVARFMQLLGKPADAARLRAFAHRLNPNRAAIGPRKGPLNLAEADRWQREGRGVYMVINDGGDTAESITLCRAFFVEWDNKPLDWQRTAWQALGLGEPTFMVATGGKSIHCYWTLKEPISRQEWEPIQAALIQLCGADRACKDASRVMRLAGASYIGPSGQPTGSSRIINATGNRYSLAEVLSWLPATTKPEPERDEHADLREVSESASFEDLPPRPPEALREALQKVPPFAPNQKQYPLLLGLARRLLVEVGKDEAITLLRKTCAAQITDLESYFVTPAKGINPGSVWAYLRDEFKIDIRRHDLRGKRPQGQQRQQAADPKDEAGDSGHAPEPPTVLSLEEVRRQLAYAIQQGVSRTDLEVLRIQLASAADLQPQALLGVLRELQQEQENAIALDAEKGRLQAAAQRQRDSSVLRLTNLMPPQIAWALETRTRTLPADSIAAAAAFLCSVSSVVKLGTEIIASEAHDFRAPLNLYCALVARSGAKKSPTSRLLIDKPTNEIRLDLARQHTRAMEEWKEENRGKKGADKSEPPRPAFISVSDFTAEALAAQLQEQEARGLGLLLNRDELAGLFGALNAYRKGRGGDEQLLLEAYDGSPFYSLRVATTGGGRFYSRCHLSIWGSIQPDILRALIADGDASGLWARFLFVPLPERVVPIPAEDTKEDMQQAAKAAADLAAICEAVYRMPRQSLTLSREARAAFVAYEQRTQEQIKAAQLGAQGALLGKAAGKVLRIAGLMHLISVAGNERKGREVDASTIEMAALLVDHLNGWTMSLHQSVADGQTDDLMRLVHRLAETAGEPIGWRDVRSRFSRKQRQEHDAAAVTAAMQGLAELGVGQVEKGARDAIRYRSTGPLA